jgi:hypothetical protein
MIEIILFNVLLVLNQEFSSLYFCLILDTCLHPGFLQHGKTYVVNYGTSRYILSVNVSLRHGASLQFECDSGLLDSSSFRLIIDGFL